tara:strand:+ start:262 stop:447 length:186 start_codon:yes stop_codon:yes gene_type:complete
MPSTPAERTVLIKQEKRLVFVDIKNTISSRDRTVLVKAQDRFISIERKPTSADRVVYANEE